MLQIVLHKQTRNDHPGFGMHPFLMNLMAKGQYNFTTTEAVSWTGKSEIAVRAVIRRAREKGQLATPFKGFHVIVPPEYAAMGCVPADQFVPQLMKHLGLPYYAGLLTAAALHGAAHQAPMVFQVVIPEHLPPIDCGMVRVRFIERRNAADIPCSVRNTSRDVLRVSSPEATALDLVGYSHHAAGLSNVATILAELWPRLDPAKLVAELQHSPVPWFQRLGYLMELVGAIEPGEALHRQLASVRTKMVPLRTGWAFDHAPRNTRWQLWINDDVESDL